MNNIVDTGEFLYVNICDYLEADDESIVGELEEMLSDFSCPRNQDVERFLKKNAIEFAKKKQSITYLVFALTNMDFVGYFTIALKPLSIHSKNKVLSSRMRNKVGRVSEIDEESQSYLMSAFLIAQLGKNFSDDINSKISGDELLKLAIEVITNISRATGGLVVFLEAEPHDKLLSFYEKDSNGFKPFSERTTNGEYPHELVRLIRVL